MSNRTAQQSRKMLAMSVDEVFDMRTARLSLKRRFVMIHIYWLPWFVFGNGPGTSFATGSRGPDAGKNCKGCLWRYQFPFVRSSRI